MSWEKTPPRMGPIPLERAIIASLIPMAVSNVMRRAVTRCDTLVLPAVLERDDVGNTVRASTSAKVSAVGRRYMMRTIVMIAMCMLVVLCIANKARLASSADTLESPEDYELDDV